jgi:hypothetical protein
MGVGFVSRFRTQNQAPATTDRQPTAAVRAVGTKPEKRSNNLLPKPDIYRCC